MKRWLKLQQQSAEIDYFLTNARIRSIDRGELSRRKYAATQKIDLTFIVHCTYSRHRVLQA
jgi:hypothetical protein